MAGEKAGVLYKVLHRGALSQGPASYTFVCTNTFLRTLTYFQTLVVKLLDDIKHNQLMFMLGVHITLLYTSTY